MVKSGCVGPKIERGDAKGFRPKPSSFRVPPPSPGWTWPLRFRTVAFLSTGEPGEGRLHSGDSWLPAFRGAGPRRPEVPARFPRVRPTEAVRSLEPGPCLVAWTGPKTALGALIREPDRFALSPGSPRFSAPPCPSAH